MTGIMSECRLTINIHRATSKLRQIQHLIIITPLFLSNIQRLISIIHNNTQREKASRIPRKYRIDTENRYRYRKYWNVEKWYARLSYNVIMPLFVNYKKLELRLVFFIWNTSTCWKMSMSIASSFLKNYHKQYRK